MNYADLWVHFKSFFIDIVNYGFPSIAILISVLSYKNSRKASRVQDRINEIDEKLKQYELKQVENELEESEKAIVDARIIKISSGNHRIKFWNSGKATAYNVNFELEEEEEQKGIIMRDKVPYEFLEPGKTFEECVFVHHGTPRKFKIMVTWTNKQGIPFSKEQLVTV